MKQFLCLCLMAAMTIPMMADDRQKDIERLQGASQVLDEVMAAKDSGIPEDILSGAKCLAVVPSYLKGGFIFGGSYGKGVASCKTDKGWSTPAFFNIEGGSFGFQIGGQAVDYIMVIMNDEGMKNLLESKFKLGADASVAAGPIGRHAEGGTDWKLRAQILTYSRARGAFAGVSLSGAVVRQNQDDTRAFYGRMVPFRTLLTGKFTPTPVDANQWLDTLNKYAPFVGGPATPVQPAATPAPPPGTPTQTTTPPPASSPQR